MSDGTYVTKYKAMARNGNPLCTEIITLLTAAGEERPALEKVLQENTKHLKTRYEENTDSFVWIYSYNDTSYVYRNEDFRYFEIGTSPLKSYKD